MHFYEEPGRSEETGVPVTVQLGWDKRLKPKANEDDPDVYEGGWFFAVFDAGGRVIAGKLDLLSPDEVWWGTRAYLTWTEQIRQAVRDLPDADYLDRHPASDPYVVTYNRLRGYTSSSTAVAR